MIVRQKQLEDLQPLAEKDFIKRLIDHLQAEYPYEIAQYPQPELRKMVRNGISRARRYGISVESSLAAFVDLMFTVAPNFDEQPQINAVLKGPSAPPDTRVELLGEATLPQDWEQTDNLYDEAAWNVSFD